MDNKTPLRLKLKLGSGGASTSAPSSPGVPTVISKMTEEDAEQMVSDEDYEEDFQENGQGEMDYEIEGSSSKKQSTQYEEGGRERHKKSKKKKKKREREKERHKHKHHKERNEVEEEEPPLKKQLISPPQDTATLQLGLMAFKDLLGVLLQNMQKRDTQRFFTYPVTDAIAPGYSSIISEPMDFSTMHKKVQECAYANLALFEYDMKLICNNCMIYNQPDTIYYKAAKRLLHSVDKICSAQRIIPLKRDIPNLIYVTKDQLGFDVNSEEFEAFSEAPADSPKVSDNENSQDADASHFEAIPDNITPEEILDQAQRAADEAAEKLTLKKPVSTLGFLRQRRDGTTTLNFLSGCEGNDPNQKEKPVSLGLITGKLTQGSSSLINYRADKQSMAKPVKPLYYGSFSSFCPSYDSTFANLNKEESDMVYATYGNETAVQYAESICGFSRDCDMAMHLVDQLLNLLTHQQHSRTKAQIEDRKRIQQEEQKINSLLFNAPDETSTAQPKDFSPNFNSLRTLKDLGINTSFLSTLEKIEQREKVVGAKLNDNAVLLESLAKEQKERLSKPLPANFNKLPQPSPNEIKLAEKVSEGLMSVAREVPPGALAPVPIVRRALGITMRPVSLDTSDQIEVNID